MLPVNARCLAYHGPLLYEAKALRVYDPETKTAKARAAPSEGSGEKEVPTTDLPEELRDSVAYFVHYKGWKSTWDEWIGPDRVMEWNEENIRKQKELKQAALAAMNSSKQRAKAASATSTSPVPADQNGPPGGTKRKDSKDESGSSSRGPKRRNVELEVEKEEEFIKRPEIAITVPDVLKALLVDDWEYITKEHQLVSLPRKPNVEEILRMYRDYVPPKREGSAEADIFDEVLSGLKLYFDRSLGNILLYRFERQQYKDIRAKNPGTPMSKIYGAEHLIRLFVSLPRLIAQTHMDQQGISYLKDHLEDLLRFLAKKRNELFLKQYEHTSSSYEAAARGV
ncbi:chromatin modification-related protein Eaf3p [Trichomonascus vanleenenianus]|uniref:Eaf3p n=1 Tax=Trichomonascus vanleenenianus TaxID=2268995 RepID=UPI003EC9BA3C